MRKSLIKLQTILNEKEVYTKFVEDVLKIYYEGAKYSYDKDRGVWVDNDKEYSFDEMEDVFTYVLRDISGILQIRNY